MRLLDRYLLRELLVPLAYCLSGFLIIYSSFDLIYKLHKFQEYQMSFGDCLEYYLVTGPETFVLLAPVTLLMALLYAVSNHARHHEFTAMRAAGVSLWRITMPYLGVAALLSAAVFAANEFWVPDAATREEKILLRHNGQSTERADSLKFSNESEGRDWNIKSYSAATGVMRKPSVIWLRPDGTREEIYAQSATFANGQWEFANAEILTTKPGLTSIAVHTTNALAAYPFAETPELIRSEIKFNKLELRQTFNRAQMSLREIFDFLRLHPKVGPAQKARLMTQFHGRLAAPLTCLTVVLIAVPLGARSGRRNVFVGVASSIVICFVYIVTQSVCLALGNFNWLPPIVAAWLPNLGFGAAGVWMIKRAR